MKALDKERQLREILQEFQNIDKTYFEYEKEFIQLLEGTIDEFYPHFLLQNDSDDEFKHFANLIFNTAESVIDKDRSYPNYRLVQELESFKRINQARHSFEMCSPEFSETLSKRLKQISIKYFNNIYQLSGNGFRLLELNINHSISIFLDWFNLQLEVAE